MGRSLLRSGPSHIKMARKKGTLTLFKVRRMQSGTGKTKRYVPPKVAIAYCYQLIWW